MSEATFTNYSAAIVSLKAPNGHQLNMKFDNVENYKSPENPFLGASIGRVANRIFGSKINVQGQEYELNANEGGKNTLHGGALGWGKREWEGPFEEEKNGRKATVYTISSDHLDQGFPGKVHAKVYYIPYSVTNDEGIEEFFLEIEYECKLADDSPVDETVVSMTNHAHCSVSPNQDSIDGTRMKLFTNKWLEKADGKITGNVVDCPEVPSDNSFFTMTKEGPKLDDNFVLRDLDQFDGIDSRHLKPKPAVHYYHPDNNVNLQIFTTEPTFQIYSCEFMDIPKLEGESRNFPYRCAVACEPSRPVNSPGIEKWQKWVTLKRGETYGSKIVYCSWVGETKEY